MSLPEEKEISDYLRIVTALNISKNKTLAKIPDDEHNHVTKLLADYILTEKSNKFLANMREQSPTLKSYHERKITEEKERRELSGVPNTTTNLQTHMSDYSSEENTCPLCQQTTCKLYIDEKTGIIYGSKTTYNDGGSVYCYSCDKVWHHCSRSGTRRFGNVWQCHEGKCDQLVIPLT